MPTPISVAKAIAAVKEAPGTRVKVAVSDIDGVLRGKYLHKEKFYSAVEGGFGFCDVVFGWDMMDVTYDNTTHTGWHKGFPDVLARIDLGTLRRVPWDGDVPFFLADFVVQKGGKEAPLPDLPAAGVEARAEARRKAGRHADVRDGVRMVQLPRDAADLGRQAGRRADAAHARHVRLLAAARQREPGVLRSAVRRHGRVRRADRRPAHGDRAGRLRGGDPVFGSAGAGRSRDPVQDRRQGNRRALRHHAELHGQVEQGLSGLLGPRAHVAVGRQDEPVPRRQPAGTA